MDRLFIAEKPSVAAALAALLGITGQGSGYFVCGEDYVSSCFGHLFEMSMPEDYDPAFKQWDMAHLPILPEQWPVNPKPKALERIELLGRMMKNAAIVVNAGDPDNEGQLLVDDVIEYHRFMRPVLRFWASAQDPKSLAYALANMRENNGYSGMRDAARARGRVDWLIGMNASRAFTLRAQSFGNSTVVPVGRVLTPMLAMVAARDDLFANFKPIPYHHVVAVFQHGLSQFSARWFPNESHPGLDEEGRVIDTTVADALVARLQGVTGSLTSLQMVPKIKGQPKSFSLAGIGLLASEKFGYSAAATLEICQSLYEKKMVSYPRTDSEYLPENQFAAGAEILAAIKHNMSEVGAWIDAADPSIQSKTWDAEKTTAHHGIIPTGLHKLASDLSAEEFALYQLICRGYIAQFYPVHEFQETSIVVTAEEEIFKAKGKAVTEEGWKVLYHASESDEGEEGDDALPSMQQGDDLRAVGAQRQDKRTTPPKRFTEGTLPIAMENVHRYFKDVESQAELKPGDSIGTPATRGGIIEESKRKGYLVNEGKWLVSTELCAAVLRCIPPLLKNPVLTAKFQRQLRDMENGVGTLDQFVHSQGVFVADLVAMAKDGMPVALQCPACGKGVLGRRERKDGSGAFWSCSGWKEGCGFSANDDDGIPVIEDPEVIRLREANKIKCPSCGDGSISRKERKDKTGFFWSCSAWKKGCKFIANDNQGAPVLAS